MWIWPSNCLVTTICQHTIFYLQLHLNMSESTRSIFSPAPIFLVTSEITMPFNCSSWSCWEKSYPCIRVLYGLLSKSSAGSCLAGLVIQERILKSEPRRYTFNDVLRVWLHKLPWYVDSRCVACVIMCLGSMQQGACDSLHLPVTCQGEQGSTHIRVHVNEIGVIIRNS